MEKTKALGRNLRYLCNKMRPLNDPMLVLPWLHCRYVFCQLFWVLYLAFTTSISLWKIRKWRRFRRGRRKSMGPKETYSPSASDRRHSALDVTAWCPKNMIWHVNCNFFRHWSKHRNNCFMIPRYVHDQILRKPCPDEREREREYGISQGSLQPGPWWKGGLLTIRRAMCVGASFYCRPRMEIRPKGPMNGPEIRPFPRVS